MTSPGATPLPITFLGLAIATTVYAGLETQVVPQADFQTVGWLVVAVPVPMQLLAAVWGLIRGELAAATGSSVLAATWLLLRGLEHSRDADLTLRTGLLLAGVSVAKLFLFDLAALSGLVRSVAFIVTGLLLLATGSRYAKAWERRRATA